MDLVILVCGASILGNAELDENTEWGHRRKETMKGLRSLGTTDTKLVKLSHNISWSEKRGKHAIST